MQKKIATMVAIFCLSLLSFQLTTLGNLNSNEAELIAIAQGGFEYEGETYRVKDSYIKAAITYLSQDDIDVTDSQKQKAISMMYGNIPEGIERGYLIKVDNSTTDDTVNDSNSTNNEDPSNPATNSAGNTSSSEGSTTTPSDETSELQPEPQPYTPPPVLTALEKAKEITLFPTMPEEPSLLQEIAGTAFYTNAPTGLLLTNLTLLILFIIIAFWFGMLPGKRHKKKGFRKTRQILCYLSAISLSALIALGIILPLFARQHFQKDEILQKLNDNGYYTEIYNEAVFDTKLAFLLLDIPTAVADEILTPEKIFLSANGYVNGIFEGKGAANLQIGQYKDLSQTAIQDYLKTEGIDLTSLTPEAKSGLEYLCQELDNRIINLMKLPDAESWYEAGISSSTEIRAFLQKAGILLVIYQLFLFLIHHHKKPWLKYLGVTLSLAALLSLLTAYLFTPLWNWREALGNESYIREVAERSLEHGRSLLLVPAGILFFIGLIFILWASRKKRDA